MFLNIENCIVLIKAILLVRQYAIVNKYYSPTGYLTRLGRSLSYFSNKVMDVITCLVLFGSAQIKIEVPCLASDSIVLQGYIDKGGSSKSCFLK